MIDEIEQAVVGPMQVFENEHEWALVGQRLKEAAPSRERLSAVVATEFSARLKANERAQVTFDPLGVRCLQRERPDRPGELGLGLLGWIGVKDSRVGLDDLAKRPEGDSFRVRERAALPPGDELGALRDELEQLGNEAALADAGHADEGHELDRALVLGPLERAREQLPFVIAAHERCLALGKVRAEPGPRLERFPHRDGLGLALCRDRLGGAVLDRSLRGAVRGLVHEHTVRRRSGLQP